MGKRSPRGSKEKRMGMSQRRRLVAPLAVYLNALGGKGVQAAGVAQQCAGRLCNPRERSVTAGEGIFRRGKAWGKWFSSLTEPF